MRIVGSSPLPVHWPGRGARWSALSYPIRQKLHLQQKSFLSTDDIYGIGVGVPVEAVEEEDHSQRWEGPMHCGERKSDHVDYNLPSQTPIDSIFIHQV